jgi:NADH-quinone oxidoreductase subunit N
MLHAQTILNDLDGIAPLLVLWGTASLVLLGDVFIWRRSPHINTFLSVVGLCLACYSIFVGQYEEGKSVFAGTVLVDSLTYVGWISLLLTGLLAVALASTYLKNRGLEHSEYYVLLLLSLTGAMLMVSSGDLLVLFIALEVLSVALYVMAGFARTEERSEEAAIKYFLLGAFASGFLLFGIALIYGGTATTNLKVISEATSAMMSSEHAGATPILLAGIALLIVGLGFKAAVIPFHQWTPDVYEGAPTSVTAYMAAAAKIGAIVGIIRVFDALIPVHSAWLPAIQVIAILTMVFGNLLAITQSNVKRMLAYSSIAHAGYLLVAVAAMAFRDTGPPGIRAYGLAQNGALFYLFAYVLMTIGSFGVLVYLSGRGRDYQLLEELRGLARHDPLAAYSMTFFMLSLGGIPPTMGFWGKWQIFVAAIYGGQIGLAIVMALASALAIYYYLRIVWMMCFEEPREPAPAAPTARLGASLSVLVSAVLTLLFGIAPGLFMDMTTFTP